MKVLVLVVFLNSNYRCDFNEAEKIIGKYSIVIFIHVHIFCVKLASWIVHWKQISDNSWHQ